MSASGSFPRPIHGAPHPETNRHRRLAAGLFAGSVRIVDWFDRIAGRSWMLSDHPGVIVYAARREAQRLPFDDDVLLVQTGDGAHALIHADEFSGAVIDEARS